MRCRRFCIRVCPPIFNHPWFTHVGDFDIYGDFDPGTGLTNKAQGGHGGPDYGFFGCLKLRGFCPKYSPAFSGAPMAYRFLFRWARRDARPITGGFVSRRARRDPVHVLERQPARSSSRCGFAARHHIPDPAAARAPWAHAARPLHRPGPEGLGHGRSEGARRWLQRLADGLRLARGRPRRRRDAGRLGCRHTRSPPLQRKDGVDVAIIFQATRVSDDAAVNGGAAPDYTNQLSRSTSTTGARSGSSTCSSSTRAAATRARRSRTTSTSSTRPTTSCSPTGPRARHGRRRSLPAPPSGRRRSGRAATPARPPEHLHVADLLVHGPAAHEAQAHRRPERRLGQVPARGDVLHRQAGEEAAALATR